MSGSLHPSPPRRTRCDDYKSVQHPLLSTAHGPSPHPFPQGETLTIHSLGMALCTSNSGVVHRRGPAGMAGADDEKGPGRLVLVPGPWSDRGGPDMHDATAPRPLARRDREDRLRAAARLLEHLADGRVPEDEQPAVELAVGDLLGKAGVLP